MPRGWFCKLDHAVMYGQIKQAQAAEKRRRKAQTEEKQGIKTIRQLKSEAQTQVNRYIRARDYGKPCISCGKSHDEIIAKQGWKTGGAFDAGHYMSRGAKQQLRFNLLNIHRQCKNCNGGGGKFSAKAATVDARYKENIINKIGLERVVELENNNEKECFTREYLIRIKKIFSKRANYYEKLRRNR